VSDAERPGSQPEPQGPYGPQGSVPPPAGPAGYHQPGQPARPEPVQGPPAPGPWQPYGPGAAPQPLGARPPQGGFGQAGPYGPPPGPYGPTPGQPGPYGPAPGQPGPYGPIAGQVPGGRPKSKLPLILAAAGVALLLVIGVSVAALTGGDDSSAAAGVGGGGGAVAAEKPSDAVRGYLEALAANDAEKALGYLDEPPADTTFLSRPVLEASAQKAALTAVDVPEVTDEYTYRVPARYRLGDQAVSDEFSVTDDSGSWKLSRAVTEFDLSYQRDETLPMKINGVEVTTDSVSLFPGAYTVTTDSKWVTYGDKASFTLTGPSDYDAPRLTPTLSDAGRSAFLKATRSAFEKCLDERELAPSDCPNRLNLRPGQKVTTSSIRWSVTTDPFKNARVTLSSSDPTVAEASFYPSYRFRAKGTQDGRSVTFDGGVIGFSSFRSTGDLSGDEVEVDLTNR
jgi:hypothetical protein